MHKVRTLVTLGAALLASGCDVLLTEVPADAVVFEGPIDGLTGAQLRSFFAGDEAFGRFFAADTGLGPIFNAAACVQCHPGDGRGHPSLNLLRFGRGDPNDPRAFDYLEALGGPQLQDRAIPGYEPETLPPDVVVSERGGPIVAGLGLLEGVPAATLRALEDPDDLDGDGISGRLSFVVPPDFVHTPATCDCDDCRLVEGTCRLLGRFGRKATAVNLLQQTVSAYHQDMGITSDRLPDELFNPSVGGPSGDTVPEPEVGSDEVANVVFYLRTLRPPARRSVDDPEVLAGEALFTTIGCAACHLPALPTGASAIEPLAFTTAAAYTDLLLHDMGEALADDFPEGDATGREWRTTPLWGLGIVATQLGGEAFYLHDGRARSLSEAILLHGGEALAASQRFAALSAAERRRLLAFLASL